MNLSKLNHALNMVSAYNRQIPEWDSAEHTMEQLSATLTSFYNSLRPIDKIRILFLEDSRWFIAKDVQTSVKLSDDVSSLLNYLVKRGEIDRKKIGYLFYYRRAK